MALKKSRTALELKVELEELRARLAEAEETLRAIREGEVDALIVSGSRGDQVFSLTSTESIYRLIVETMKEAAFTLDCDGKILFCNAQFAQFVKHPPEQVVGRPLREFVAETDAAEVPSLLAAALERPVKKRLVFRATDGSTLPAHISSNVLNQPDCVSICVVATDLTELENSTELIQQLRRQQEALLTSEAKLAEQKQEMEDLLYITTHDLRSPVVNIQGFSHILGMKFKELCAALPEELRNGELAPVCAKGAEYLDLIIGSAVKMNGMLDLLIKIARLGHLELRVADVDMNAALKTVLTSISYQLERSGGVVNMGQLPPCKADPGVINQIFSNLLGNAVKYRDPDRKPVITVNGEILVPGKVLYTVSDNGLGLNERDLANIWRLFYRAHAQAPGVEKGEGIGLTMVKRMVEKSGGGIRAASQEGKGTQFFLELPA